MTPEADGLSFDAIRPWVYRVVDELLDVDPGASQLSAGERVSQRQMAGAATALAILDGGVLIHSMAAFPESRSMGNSDQCTLYGTGAGGPREVVPSPALRWSHATGATQLQVVPSTWRAT